MSFMSFGLAVTSLEGDWYYLTQFHDNEKPGLQFASFLVKMAHFRSTTKIKVGAIRNKNFDQSKRRKCAKIDFAR